MPYFIRASVMGGSAPPQTQLPPLQAGYSLPQPGKLPGKVLLSKSTPSHHYYLVGEPMPGGPRSVCSHSSLGSPGTLEVQAPAVLRIHGVTGLPHKGPWPSKYRPGPESQSCLSHPQRQDWKDWGLSWSSPFLIPLSVAFPVCLPCFPSVHHHVSLPLPGFKKGTSEVGGKRDKGRRENQSYGLEPDHTETLISKTSDCAFNQGAIKRY